MSNSKYRLKPVSTKMWVVQQKGWLFWNDMPGKYRGDQNPGYYPQYVHSIEEGEKAIEHWKDVEVFSARRKAEDRVFLKANPPKEY